MFSKSFQSVQASVHWAIIPKLETADGEKSREKIRICSQVEETSHSPGFNNLIFHPLRVLNSDSRKVKDFR